MRCPKAQRTMHGFNKPLPVLMTGLALSWLLAGCTREQGPIHSSDLGPGPILFENHCSACHGASGQGIEGEGPPLESTSWVTGRHDRLIRIVLHGLRGTIQIRGVRYDREMPGFGQVLSDSEVASLVSFVRTRFGSASEPITPASVRQVRTETGNRTGYWTVEELLDNEQQETNEE